MARAKKVESVEVEKPQKEVASELTRPMLIMRALGVLALVVCISAMVFISRRGVDERFAKSADAPTIVFLNRPAWMSDAVFDRLTQSVTPGGSRSSLDHNVLTETVRILENEPWVKSVKQVRRGYTKSPGDTIEIDCEFRAPVAFVRDSVVQRYWMVDATGVVLPESYREDELKRLGYGDEARKQPRQIVGVEAPSPPPGQVWKGEDLVAGIEMVRLMFDKPYLNEIIEVDVANFAGRRDQNFAQIVLRTVKGTEVWWGRPVSAPDNIAEISPQQKLATLEKLYQQFDRIDAHQRWVDVRFERPTRPKDGTGSAKIDE
jgi:hypothetical protein